LTIPSRGRIPSSSGEDVEIVSQERGGDQERRRGGVSGTLEDLGRRVGMVADQAMEEGCVVVGHSHTVDLTHDAALTAPAARGWVP
jgi:hypothetical protein